MSADDCIIDGGGANQVPCKTENDPGVADDANAWAPRRRVDFDANQARREERFIASAGQQNFTLTQFSYVRNTGSLVIYKNGLLIALDIDWVEQSTSGFALVEPAAERIVTGKQYSLHRRIE